MEQHLQLEVAKLHAIHRRRRSTQRRKTSVERSGLVSRSSASVTFGTLNSSIDPSSNVLPENNHRSTECQSTSLPPPIGDFESNDDPCPHPSTSTTPRNTSPTIQPSETKLMSNDGLASSRSCEGTSNALDSENLPISASISTDQSSSTSYEDSKSSSQVDDDRRIGLSLEEVINRISFVAFVVH